MNQSTSSGLWAMNGRAVDLPRRASSSATPSRSLSRLLRERPMADLLPCRPSV